MSFLKLFESNHFFADSLSTEELYSINIGSLMRIILFIIKLYCIFTIVVKFILLQVSTTSLVSTSVVKIIHNIAENQSTCSYNIANSESKNGTNIGNN